MKSLEQEKTLKHEITRIILSSFEFPATCMDGFYHEKCAQDITDFVLGYLEHWENNINFAKGN